MTRVRGFAEEGEFHVRTPKNGIIPLHFSYSIVITHHCTENHRNGSFVLSVGVIRKSHDEIGTCADRSAFCRTAQLLPQERPTWILGKSVFHSSARQKSNGGTDGHQQLHPQAALH